MQLKSMKKSNRPLYYLFLRLIFLTTSVYFIQVVYPDEIITNNGTHIKGYIKEQNDDYITFITPDTTIKLEMTAVKKVKRESKSDSFIYLGDEFLKRKLYRYAQEYYLKANNAGEDKKIIDQKLKTLNYLRFKDEEFSQVDKLIDAEDYRKALDEYLSLLTKYSDAPFADEIKQKISFTYRKLAEIAFDHIDSNAAYFYLQRALKYDPFSYKVHNTFANILQQQGYYEQAIKEYQESLKINPKQYDLKKTIAKLESQYGKPDTLKDISIITRIADAKIANVKASLELQQELPDKEKRLKNKAIDVLLQAYNAGPGAVIVYDGDIAYDETKKYVANVNYWLNKNIRKNKYDNIIEKNAQKFNLDKNLVKAIIKIESDFDPYAISKADARGLMQITRVTWNDTIERLGVDWDYNEYAFDPEKNIIVGCHYLSWLKSQYLPTFFGDIFA